MTFGGSAMPTSSPFITGSVPMSTTATNVEGGNGRSSNLLADQDNLGLLREHVQYAEESLLAEKASRMEVQRWLEDARRQR